MIHVLKYQVLDLLKAEANSQSYYQVFGEKVAQEYADKNYWFADTRANWAQTSAKPYFERFVTGLMDEEEFAAKLSKCVGFSISKEDLLELIPGIVETHQSNKKFWQDLSNDLHEEVEYQKALVIPSEAIESVGLMEEIARNFHFRVVIKEDLAIFDNGEEGLVHIILDDLFSEPEISSFDEHTGINAFHSNEFEAELEAMDDTYLGLQETL